MPQHRLKRDRWLMLRQKLQLEPSEKTWIQVLQLLQAWEPETEKQVAIEYANQHIGIWNETLKPGVLLLDSNPSLLSSKVVIKSYGKYRDTIPNGLLISLGDEVAVLKDLELSILVKKLTIMANLSEHYSQKTVSTNPHPAWAWQWQTMKHVLQQPSIIRWTKSEQSQELIEKTILEIEKPHLKELDLSTIQMTNSLLKALTRVHQKAPRLESLILANCSLRREHLEFLTDHFPWEKLTSITLRRPKHSLLKAKPATENAIPIPTLARLLQLSSLSPSCIKSLCTHLHQQEKKQLSDILSTHSFPSKQASMIRQYMDL